MCRFVLVGPCPFSIVLLWDLAVVGPVLSVSTCFVLLVFVCEARSVLSFGRLASGVVC